MTTSAINLCPMCDTTPKLAGVFRYQVRCACGACGPRQPTQQEAVSRWNSVVYFVQQFRGSDGPSGDSRYKPAFC
jgi:hypothetical protein